MPTNPKSKYLIVDAHEDLAWNMLTFGRDYTRSAYETRQREANTQIPARNDQSTLGYPEYRRGRVAVVFSTLFAAPLRARVDAWDSQVYADFEQAHKLYRGQIDAYRRLTDEHPKQFHLVETLPDLQEVLAAWENLPLEEETPAEEEPPKPEEEPAPEPDLPVGLVPLMEGAEGVRTPAELEEWWELGVRIIGPAWMGTRYGGGSHEPGPLTSEGALLLEAMGSLGFALDLSHLDLKAALQALDLYPGTVIASHANAQALLHGYEGNRHLPDPVIRSLIERDGVMGIVPFNGFLLPGWTIRDGREKVPLDMVVAQIDYVCQMAGDARHVGLGTDYDGGFGSPRLPLGVETIADLQKLAPLLAEKGYNEADIAAIFGQNWIRILRGILPEAV